MGETITGWVGAVLVVLILIGAPVGCMVSQNQQATDAIKVVCAGDMASDSAKAILCQSLIRKLGGTP